MKFRWIKGAPERLRGTEVDVRIEKGLLKIDIKCEIEGELTDAEQKAIDGFCDEIARQVGAKEESRQKVVKNGPTI